MLNLSKYANDKDSYIVSIAIDELFDKFKVTYASGRVEEHDFSIHNYQVYILRMEEQFHSYKKDYENDLNSQFNEEVKKCIIANVVAMMGISITCGFDIHLAIKIILAFLGSMFVIYNLNKVAKKRKEVISEADKAAMVEVLIQHKKDIELNVVDPVTGRDEKWYMVDVNNIEQFTSAFELAMYAMPYRVPQVKEEMEKDMSQAFKDAYTLKMKKNS